MRGGWSSRLAGAACAALASHVCLVGCTQAASSTPLGMGPLAVAELSAPPAPKAEPEPPAAKKADTEAAPALGEVVVVAEGESSPNAAAPEEDGESGQASAAGPSSIEDFEGMFAGDDIAVFRLTGFPEREQRDERAKIRIEKAGAGSVSITLINSEDGSDLCDLSARVEGKAALIESAQPCFSDGGEGSLEALLTSGRAVLNGDHLRMDAEGTLSVALPDQELDGKLTYSFKGKRE
jgi:hypothetical protein